MCDPSVCTSLVRLQVSVTLVVRMLNVFHSFRSETLGGTVWRSLGGTGLLEEVLHLGWALRKKQNQTLNYFQ